MKLLNEIIDEAASDNTRLTTILRKCLIVAFDLKNDKLQQWVQNELNGYSQTDDLPPYRITRIVAKGTFLGPMMSQINNQPLMASALKANHRFWATTASLNEAIAAYEEMSKGESDGSAQIPWPADLVVIYQSKFFEGYALNRAWQEIPMGAIIGVVDTVRTRVLQFALEVRSELAVEGDGETVPPPAFVDRAVQTIIYGGNNIVGSIQGDVRQIGQQIVVKGNFHSLSTALEKAGVPAADIAELEGAISHDKKEGAENGLGKRVGAWLQNAGSVVGKEGVKAAAGVAQSAITPLVMSYFGLNR